MPDGPLRSLLVDGVIAGVGSVLVFLPQILILFFFILLLEDSGYLPRAAFLLDRLMGRVGLSGRAFIPLLSSFACAIPGIMAARTIPNMRDRLATIMLAPLMTCSARLPVYALLIGAFIPAQRVGVFNLQGLVLFALYVAGIVGAVLVALVMKRFTLKSSYHPLMMELPEYRWPNLRNLVMGLWERTKIFLTRVGTIILALMIVLWFLSSFPGPPPGATGPPIEYSIAGMMGRGLQIIFAPIGFNWQISIALVPGLAAREVAVGALGTVYALVSLGGQHRRRADAHDRRQLEPAHGAVTAGLVCVRAAMPVDAGHGEARDQFLALSADHGRLPVCHGLRGVVPHLSHCAGGDVMSQALQLVIVTLLVVGAAVFATWRLISGALRLRTIEALLRVYPKSGWLQDLAARQRTATGCSACERNPEKRV